MTMKMMSPVMRPREWLRTTYIGIQRYNFIIRENEENLCTFRRNLSEKEKLRLTSISKDGA